MLVVFNDEQQVVAEAFAETAKPRARALTLLKYPTLSRHGEEPPADVAETVGDGTIVFDGSLGGYGLLTTPVRVTVEGGRAVDANTIGTIHLAFGTSAGLGGVNLAGVHIDGMVLHPAVELDGERVLDDGRLHAPS